MKLLTSLSALALLSNAALAAPRDIQIVQVNFNSGVVTIRNLGPANQTISGFRFCTADDNQQLQYTGTTGLSGLSLDPGEDFHIHWNNDAPADPNARNVSALGGFSAQPMDRGPWGLALYSSSPFGTPANMVDYVQWTDDLANPSNFTADARAPVATSALLWSANADFVVTTPKAVSLDLTDLANNTAHSPADYNLGGGPGGGPLADPIPTPVPLGAVNVQLATVATGLTAPNWGTNAPGVSGRLYVSDQNGIFWNINLADGSKSVFLDVSSIIVTLGIGGPGTFDERGLLGVAFHPNYQANGLLYTYTSEPNAGAADFSTIPVGETADHQTVIREWNVPEPGDLNATVNFASSRILLTIDQPQFNHNAGAINFGADNMLYIALGDGGASDDEGIGHGVSGNGQDPTNPLGSILRIDPLGNNSANSQYGIPFDNPFVPERGANVQEIFAFGFRNPFRFSFDGPDLYVADVGQNDIEEVDIVTSGDNYGWNLKEGSFFFDPNGVDPGFITNVDPGVPAGLVDPIAQYDHDEGIAIVGGFVYRGVKIPALTGSYIFGDFAQTFSNDGRLFYLDGAGDVVEFNLLGQPALNLSLLGFGQDENGEVYVLANNTGVPFGVGGVVLRIAPKIGDLDANGVVGSADLANLLGSWGQPGGAADLDMSGAVGSADLALLLGNWG